MFLEAQRNLAQTGEICRGEGDMKWGKHWMKYYSMKLNKFWWLIFKSLILKRTYKTCCDLGKLINKDNLFCIVVDNKLELQNKSPG